MLPEVISIHADIEVAAIEGPARAERLLNTRLRRTTAPYFLLTARAAPPDPALLRELLRCLRSAPPAVVGVHAGGLYLPNTATLLRRQWTPDPVLLRTAALRQTGGWRTGEANWADTRRRHLPLLARLLHLGPILGARPDPATTGTTPNPATTKARPDPAKPGGTRAQPRAPADILPLLRPLLFRRVRLTGSGLDATGRIAAATAGLVTLADRAGGLTLLPTDRIQAVTALPDPDPPPAAWPAQSPPQRPDARPPASQCRSAASAGTDAGAGSGSPLRPGGPW